MLESLFDKIAGFQACEYCEIFINTYTLFFISNTFISKARLKLAKNPANAKQHSEAELLPFENYSHSSFMLSSKK